MSAYRLLYNSVLDVLEAMPSVKHVADFNDQYDINNQGNFNVVKYPACYLETSGVEWDKSTSKFTEKEKEPQTGTATIRVHLVYHTLKEFDKATKEIFFSHVDTVVAELMRLGSGNTNIGSFSTLMRTGEEYIFNYKQLRVCVLTFETTLTDAFPEFTDFTEEFVELVLTQEVKV